MVAPEATRVYNHLKFHIPMMMDDDKDPAVDGGTEETPVTDSAPETPETKIEETVAEATEAVAETVEEAAAVVEETPAEETNEGGEE